MIILAKYGEIILKGKNRGFFERILVQNIKSALGNTAEVSTKQSVLYIKPLEGFQIEKLQKVFGITKISICEECDCNINAISKLAKEQVKNLKGTFKVKAKRANKKFKMTSPEVEREVGARIMRDDFSVDIHEPEHLVYIEVRSDKAFVGTQIIDGAGGMPVGTSGKASLLLSGGIDSPVAGYYMARRGLNLDYIHFDTPPFTTLQSRDKVIDLANIVSEYAGNGKLYIVPFTSVQLAINEKCPVEYGTLIGRRFMMRIADKLAKKSKSKALITGESLAQVASQTLEGLISTNSATKTLTFRPLIGLDKEEIVEVSKRIGTFETSILPYDDCCSVFSPKRPKTRPDLNKVIEVESVLDIDSLVNECVENVEVIKIG